LRAKIGSSKNNDLRFYMNGARQKPQYDNAQSKNLQKKNMEQVKYSRSYSDAIAIFFFRCNLLEKKSNEK